MQRSLRSRHSNNDLSVLLVWLVIFGVGLRLLVGWPTMVTLPVQLPSWIVLQVWAVSPGGSLQGLISVAALVAWAVWLWTLASVILRAAIDIADALTRGARWVGSIRRASDWVTLPVVRHAVDASLAGLLLVRVIAQPSVASASTLPDVQMAVVTQPSVDGTEQDAGQTRNSADIAQVANENSPEVHGDLIYTVKHGDTLSAIALAFYGDADAAEQIYQANLGRPEPDGRAFNRHGLIVPGWTLTIPAPTQGIIREEGGERLYVVKGGDTLWDIAEQVLGDSDRYKELFELNVGSARLAPDGPVLRKPNLIWPGMRLRLPDQPAPPEDSPGQSNPAAAALTPDPEPPEQQTTRSASTAGLSDGQAEATQSTAGVVAGTTSTPASRSVSLPTPEASPQMVPSHPGTTTEFSAEGPDMTVLAGAGAAAASVIAGALVVRRRRRAPAPTGPETDVQVEGGFAESDPVEGLARRLAKTSDPPTAVASLMSQAYATVFAQQLSEADVQHAKTGVALAGVRHGHSATTLMLTAPVPARPHFVRAMRAAAEHAFGEHVDVDGLVSHDGDVLVRVTWDSRRPVPEKVLELVDPESQPGVWPMPSLVRLLVGYDRQPIDVNWHELTNVLVASPTGERAESPLVALVASLASARPPEDLGLMLIARPRMLPDQLGQLPHGLGDPIDPEDVSAVDQGLTRLRQELDARITNGQNAEHADIAVVVREICDLDQNALAQLAPIASAGPAHGIRLVVATERPVTEFARACTFLEEFGTRLVLQTRDEEESIVLIGTPGAEDLGRGGHALLRLESRTPIQGWACRVPAENLARLLSLMGTRAPRPSQPEPDIVVEVDTRAQDEVDDSDVELRELVSGPPPPNALAVVVEPLSAPAANGSRHVSSAIHESPLLQKLRKAPIKVRCFGARVVWHGDRVLELREAELLLLLAAHPVRGVQSEALADMLWEETLTDPERALRVRRSRLRKELRTLVPDLIGDPLPGDSAHGERVVSLNPDIISSDVHEFLELVHSASKLQGADAIQAYEQALALYEGDLLDSPDVPNFRWMYDGPQLALTLRSDYHRVHRDTRLRLAELLVAGPDSGLVRAEELFSGLCAEEPENVRLWAALFRIHERAGNSLGFESAVHKLQFALAELASGEPDAETIPLPPNLDALVNQVRSRFGTTAAAT